MTDKTPDFQVRNHGSVWSIAAITVEAIEYAEANFQVESWQGKPDFFFADHRPARDLALRLVAEGWRVQ